MKALTQVDEAKNECPVTTGGGLLHVATYPDMGKWHAIYVCIIILIFLVYPHHIFVCYYVKIPCPYVLYFIIQ